MGRRAILLGSFLWVSWAGAASLPGNLSSFDVDRITSALGLGTNMRILRSSDAYDIFPGIKLGLEIALVPSREINQLGNGLGDLPALNPAPRFYICKGLFLDLDLIFSFLPSNVLSSVSTYGIGVKWTFAKEQEQWATLALFIGYTNINAYNQSYLGENLEVGLIAGKDYVRLKPYLGGGVLFANGLVRSDYLAAGARANSLASTIHLFLGTELDLPLNLSFQMDFFNLFPGGSIFIGKRF